MGHCDGCGSYCMTNRKETDGGVIRICDKCLNKKNEKE